MQHSMQHASVGDHRQMGSAVTGRQVPAVAGRLPLMTKHLRAGPAVRTRCEHWADPENLLTDDWCRGLSAKGAQHCRAPTATLRDAGSAVCSSAMGRTRGSLSTVQHCGWHAACEFHDPVRAVVGPVTTQCSPWSCTLQPRGGFQREAACPLHRFRRLGLGQATRLGRNAAMPDCCRGPHRSTYAIRVNKECHLAVLPAQAQARPFFSRSDSLLARVRPCRLDQPNRYRHSTGSLLDNCRASRRLEGGALFGLPCTSRFSGRRVFVEFSAAATTVHGATTHGRGVAAISAVWLITRCRLEHRKFRLPP